MNDEHALDPTASPAGRRAEDRERALLLAEKDEHIRHLRSQLDALMKDRVTMANLHEIHGQQTKNADALHRLEFAIFGLEGVGGVLSSVADLRSDIRQMRDQELGDLRDMLKKTRDSIRNWVLGSLPVLVALIGLLYLFAGKH